MSDRTAAARRLSIERSGQGPQSLQWKANTTLFGQEVTTVSSGRLKRSAQRCRRNLFGSLSVSASVFFVYRGSGQVAESPRETGRKVPWPCNCRLVPIGVLVPPFKWRTRCIRARVCEIPAKRNVSQRLSIVEPQATVRVQPTRSLRFKSLADGCHLELLPPSRKPEAHSLTHLQQAAQGRATQRGQPGTSELRSKRQCWTSRVVVGGSGRWFAEDGGGPGCGHGRAKRPRRRSRRMVRESCRDALFLLLLNELPGVMLVFDVTSYCLLICT